MKSWPIRTSLRWTIPFTLLLWALSSVKDDVVDNEQSQPVVDPVVVVQVLDNVN